MVDSNDRERVQEAAQELERILRDREMRNVCLLLFCNKQDIPHSMQPIELQQIFRLDQLSRPYAIMPCSAAHGTGLAEGLKWLSKHCR